MTIETLVRTATRIVWTQKRLWVWGLFVGAGAGGVQASGDGGPATLPPHFAVLIAGVVALGMLGLCVHVVSESALIDAVDRARLGGERTLRDGWRVGRHHFVAMLGTKAIYAAIAVATLAIVVAPTATGLLLGAAPVYALPLLVLMIPAIPWLVVLTLVYRFAMRAVVLDGRAPLNAFRLAYERLHGHLVDALTLLVAEVIGGGVIGLVAAVVVVLPIVVVAALVWAIVGLVPAAVTAVVIGLPFGAALAGLMGSWRSSLWTLGYSEMAR